MLDLKLLWILNFSFSNIFNLKTCRIFIISSYFYITFRYHFDNKEKLYFALVAAELIINFRLPFSIPTRTNDQKRRTVVALQVVSQKVTISFDWCSFHNFAFIISHQRLKVIVHVSFCRISKFVVVQVFRLQRITDVDVKIIQDL